MNALSQKDRFLGMMFLPKVKSAKYGAILGILATSLVAQEPGTPFLYLSLLGILLFFGSRLAKKELAGADPKLKQVEKRLQLVTSVSQLGLWELNLTTQKILSNVYFDQAFGFKNNGPSRHWDDVKSMFLSQDAERLLASLQEIMRSGREFVEDFLIVWPDQTKHWISLTAQRSEDSIVIGTCLDITAKKKTEEILHEALFYRDEFLSIASHELKTPLTSLKLQTQIFKRGHLRNDPNIYSKEKIYRLIDQTDFQVGRMVRLVDDMLDISRIRTGRLTILRDKVNVSEVVQDVVDKAQEQFHMTAGYVVEAITCEKAYAHYDRSRLEQVMNNLLSNAFKYGKGLPIKILVTQEENQGKIFIKMIDQGIGIDKSDHERIFTRFTRAVPATEVSGLGLGLYITKQIVEAHGGCIKVESQLNLGATFIIEISCS